MRTLSLGFQHPHKNLSVHVYMYACNSIVLGGKDGDCWDLLAVGLVASSVNILVTILVL